MVLLLILFAAGTVWVYGGYAAFVAFLARSARPRPGPPKDFEPGLSVIVPAYNEEKVIEGRLENLLTQAYPREKVQIIVVDSASTDGTVARVEAFRGKGVQLLTQPERLGKGAAVAFAAKSCLHGIVVVTDANCYFEPQTLRELALPFADEKVGGVTGRFTVRDVSGKAPSAGSVVFRDYENSMRESESRIDSCVSMFGELFACRKELLLVDERNMTEDFETSLSIRRKGMRLAYAGNAVAYEYAPSTESDLFIQRRRVLTGTLQTLARHRAMLFNPRYGLYGTLILPGHKLFPVLSPFFLVPALALFAAVYPFFFLLAVMVFVACGLMQRELFKLLKYVVLVNAACLAAWKDFLGGKFSVKWQKMESTRV